MTLLKWFRIVVLLAPLLLVSAIFAQSDEGSGVEGRQAAISEISTSLDAGTVDLINAQDQLRLLRTESRLSVERLDSARASVQSQLTALGDPPENGITETTEVAERRATLLTESARLSAQLAQARLNGDDANLLLAGLTERQRAAFFNETLKPGKSALNPSLWVNVVEGASALVNSFLSHTGAWATTRSDAGTYTIDLLKLAGGALFALILFWPLRRWINSALSKRLAGRDPTELQRYSALLARLLTRIVPGVVGGFVIISVLNATGYMTEGAKSLVYAVWYVALIILASDGMALGLFEPKLPKWRIIPLTDRSATRARWLSVAAISVTGLTHILSIAGFVADEASGISNGLIVIESLLIIGLLFVAVKPSSWQLQDAAEDIEAEDAIQPSSYRRWAFVRRLGVPMMVLIAISLLLGYLNLAAFLSSRAVWFVGLATWVWIGRKTIMIGVKAFDNSFMEKRLDAESSGRKAMLFWSGLVVDIFILFATIPMVALLMGVDSYTVRSGIVDAFSGVNIGNFTFSLADVLAAILTFFTILLVTRFLQRTLDTRLFAGENADEGFRNSFRTLLGYAGLVIAVFAAIGVIGLDLSNLAIIAGALSVGIGFGLQSIVNNFVSGLILLFERPVKVGDWVVTNSGEGYVKRISVRSTEIETFDRASVIVPNSELISNSVKNWTHKDKGGRVTVPVGVAYGSDMRKVREVLYKLAEDHAGIQTMPPPFVYFKEFGASSLDVELRFFVRNIGDALWVRNDIRFEIIDAFTEHDIEIPFPQHDVHIKTSK